MSAFTRKDRMVKPVTESSHLVLLNDFDDPPPDPPIRWVDIAGKAFSLTPSTCYEHVLSNGEPYYPYYDDTLTTIDPADLDNYTSLDGIDYCADLDNYTSLDGIDYSLQ